MKTECNVFIERMFATLQLWGAADLNAEAYVCDVEVDGHDRAQHDEAANGVFHEVDTIAQAGRLVCAVSLHERDDRIEAKNRSHLHIQFDHRWCRA